ncbi:hypothetical protein TGDOM2_365400 [Toxoplasma gondii GAB2-2007-GAL-DOM2]|uniref:Transmembrane protein n=2 Tax=Toxoplasma gondii TaxID=5811 RepID=A0A425I407_TOXGO|nr:hypothetical protein TGDOM2_365400 [Toxoplasma gondii GAB2-2007-GAL-DOM2]RQX73503.1 hypothetical protein TGCAST_365400 [Toxoplasma gondii CAST]
MLNSVSLVQYLACSCFRLYLVLLIEKSSASVVMYSNYQSNKEWLIKQRITDNRDAQSKMFWGCRHPFTSVKSFQERAAKQNTGGRGEGLWPQHRRGTGNSRFNVLHGRENTCEFLSSSEYCLLLNRS